MTPRFSYRWDAERREYVIRDRDGSEAACLPMLLECETWVLAREAKDEQ